jgi:hypothetical protein
MPLYILAELITSLFAAFPNSDQVINIAMTICLPRSVGS